MDMDMVETTIHPSLHLARPGVVSWPQHEAVLCGCYDLSFCAIVARQHMHCEILLDNRQHQSCGSEVFKPLSGTEAKLFTSRLLVSTGTDPASESEDYPHRLLYQQQTLASPSSWRRWGPRDLQCSGHSSTRFAGSSRLLWTDTVMVIEAAHIFQLKQVNEAGTWALLHEDEHVKTRGTRRIPPRFVKLKARGQNCLQPDHCISNRSYHPGCLKWTPATPRDLRRCERCPPHESLDQRDSCHWNDLIHCWEARAGPWYNLLSQRHIVCLTSADLAHGRA